MLFFRDNKLSLHPEKTKFLLFSFNNSEPPQDLSIFLNNNNPNENLPNLILPLSRVLPTDKTPAIKYLGIYFDQNLNFKFHINQISKKLSNALFALRRVKNFLPQPTLKMLYYSLFHCHLIYGIETWSCVPPSSLKTLITKQKSAIRILYLESHNAHTEPLFKSLGILPLSQLISQANLKFIHSCLFNLAPSAFSNTWPTTIEQRYATGQVDLVYNLRNNSDLYVPPSRLKSLSYFPLYNLPSLWNNLPEHIKSIPTKYLFKSNLKYFFLDSLNATPLCRRLFCPACSRVNRIAVAPDLPI